MKTIPVRQPDGSTQVDALVDDVDYARASQKRWTLRKGYAMGNTTRPTQRLWRSRRGFARRSVVIPMHRFILRMDVGDPRRVRHRNGNRLDNRRANLEVV